MDGWIDIQADPAHVRREREKARAQEVIDALAAFRAAEEEVAEEEWYEEEYYEPVYYDYAPSYSEYYPTDGLTPSGGVNYYDGRTETYYSSQVPYHYRTPEWTLDDEGFYHDSDGRYVVAVNNNEMKPGTVFEGSKGECVVLDNCAIPGTTDYYVAW